LLLLAGAAVDFAGDFVREVEVVVDDLFEVDAGDVGILQQRLQRRFAIVRLVLRDATRFHVAEAEANDHLTLRQTKSFTYLAQLFTQTIRSRTRISHQESPPDELNLALLSVE
jgi:hypothetical protein